MHTYGESGKITFKTLPAADAAGVILMDFPTGETRCSPFDFSGGKKHSAGYQKSFRLSERNGLT